HHGDRRDGPAPARTQHLGTAGLDLGADVAVQVNTRSTAVGDLPAGPYLRFAVTGAHLDLAGQRVTADLDVRRGLAADGSTELAVTISNAGFSLGGGALVLTGGAGELVLAAAGLSGSLAGSIALTATGVSLTGDLAVSLTRPAAGAGTLTVTGQGITLVVLGQVLTGNLAVAAADTLHLGLSDVTLSLGGGVVRLTDGSADLTLGAGVSGTIAGTVVVAVPGVAVSGTLAASLDTAAGLLAIGGTATVTLAGVAISGGIAFTRTPTGLVLELTDGAVDLGGYLTIADLDATLAVTAAGTTGTAAAQARLVLPGILDATAAVYVAVDTAAGSLRVLLTGVDLSLGSLGRLSGDLAFTRTGTGATAQTVIALSAVRAWLGAGAEPVLTDGSGVLVLRSGGVAGYLTGTAAASAGGASISGSALLAVNTTGEAIDTSVELGGRTLAVVFADGSPSFELSISDATLTIGDFVTVEGSVTFRDSQLTIGGVPVAAQVFAGTGLMVFLGRGPARLASGALNPLAVGVLLSDARIGLVSYAGGYALVASGTVSIVGVAGLTVNGTTAVEVNTTGEAVATTLEIPGSTDAGVTLAFTGERVTRFSVADATLGFGGVALTGTLTFDRSGTDLTVTLSDGGLDLGGAASITAVAGQLTMTAAGLTGSLTATVAVPALGLAAQMSVEVDTTPTATTALRVVASGLTLSLAGQQLRADLLLQRGTGPDGGAVTVLGLAGVELTLGGSGHGVTLTGGTGLLVVSGAGLAGRIAGTLVIDLGPDASASGSFSVAVNTTAAPVATSVSFAGSTTSLALAAGPYLRVEGTGITLDILGQHL
ncbi:MAG TPA: hypothetical protein PLE12_11530, partial [Propionicimonas sp.]|nr:hypothetical protein [Propionicimonas sp.]